jgi:hypothetical protein
MVADCEHEAVRISPANTVYEKAQVHQAEGIDAGDIATARLAVGYFATRLLAFPNPSRSQDMDELQAALNELVASHGPGVFALVADAGEVIFAACAGVPRTCGGRG